MRQRVGVLQGAHVVKLSHTSNMSTPLEVSIVPVVARTLPSEVFFDCGQESYPILHICKPSASVVVRNFTIEGRLTEFGDNAFSGMAEDFAPR